MTTYSYNEVIEAIRSESAKINITYSKDGDGRLTSAVKEKEYLDLLEQGLKINHPALTFEHQPKDRWWWDFRVNGIPINLKLTTGGTDNAFNKSAIIFSICGKEVDKKNMNFNQLYQTLKEYSWKSERQPMTEYHYLVVNKNDGKILLKPILDIHGYKSNPCNILQINWAEEFLHMDSTTPDVQFKEKIQELLKTIQKSVTQDIVNKKEFAEAIFTM
jgi:hypothetical protein